MVVGVGGPGGAGALGGVRAKPPRSPRAAAPPAASPSLTKSRRVHGPGVSGSFSSGNRVPSGSGRIGPAKEKCEDRLKVWYILWVLGCDPVILEFRSVKATRHVLRQNARASGSRRALGGSTGGAAAPKFGRPSHVE